VKKEKHCRSGQATDDGVMWYMRIACWIYKSIDTHPECVMLISFPLQHRLRERAALCYVIRILPGMLRLSSVVSLLVLFILLQ